MHTHLLPLVFALILLYGGGGGSVMGAFPRQASHRAADHLRTTMLQRTAYSKGEIAPFAPRQSAPSFVLEVLNASSGDAQKFYFSSNYSQFSSIIFHAYNSSSYFHVAMWYQNHSVADFVKLVPNDTLLVLFSESDSAQLKWHVQRLMEAMQYLNYSQSKQQQFLSRVLLSIEPLGNLSVRHTSSNSAAASSSWIAELILNSNFTSSVSQILVSSLSNGNETLQRLDVRFPWLPSPSAANTSYELAYYGDACDPSVTPLQNISNRYALVDRAGNCSYFQKLNNSASYGAIGAILFTTATEPVEDMWCGDPNGIECNYPLDIAATMISYTDGLYLKNMLLTSKTGSVLINFQTAVTSASFFVIDSQGLLAELGWFLYPSLQFVGWAGQEQVYKKQLMSELQTFSSDSSITVPVFQSRVLTGGLSNVTIELPLSLEEMQSNGYDQLYLDTQLNCTTPFDASCPIWDYILEVLVSCENNSRYLGHCEDSVCWCGWPVCGEELGRWITPFRRGVGHWLTDVSPLMPLLTSQRCNFSANIVSWLNTPSWVISMNLRFNKSEEKISTRLPAKEQHSRIVAGQEMTKGLSTSKKEVPFQLLDIFSGGQFDSNYNNIHPAINFSVPNGVSRAILVAVISGHGSDNNECGEFCVTSHEWKVNNHIVAGVTFRDAGTALGCTKYVKDGAEANEHGTWLYGRDGWCDGMNVSPWTFDITSHLNLSPQANNVIEYFGYFNGTTPHPTQNPGYILMYSWISFYHTL